MDKKSLRQIMLETRAGITDKRRKSLAICERVLAAANEISAKKIFCYVAMGSEVDTERIISYYIDRHGYKLYAPYTDGTMKIKRLICVDGYVPDKHGNLPLSAYGNVDYRGGVDLTVVPMVAFDRSLHRLGYGGGYYDRFLSKDRTALSIGIAFDEQETDSIEFEDHDMSPDIIITPTRILRNESRTSVV